MCVYLNLIHAGGTVPANFERRDALSSGVFAKPSAKCNGSFLGGLVAICFLIMHVCMCMRPCLHVYIDGRMEADSQSCLHVDSYVGSLFCIGAW